MPRIRLDKTTVTDTDDTEGNSVKAHVTDGIEDDTEGNMPRVRIAKDGAEEQDDDTEGNSLKSH